MKVPQQAGLHLQRVLGAVHGQAHVDSAAHSTPPGSLRRLVDPNTPTPASRRMKFFLEAGWAMRECVAGLLRGTYCCEHNHLLGSAVMNLARLILRAVRASLEGDRQKARACAAASLALENSRLGQVVLKNTS